MIWTVEFAALAMASTNKGEKMNADRYKQLEMADGSTLTSQELEAGWHFCPNWNEMLINVHLAEGEACACKKFQEIRNHDDERGKKPDVHYP